MVSCNAYVILDIKQSIMNRKNIAILAGGDSGEYEISINSARVITEHLDPDLFNAFTIIIRGSSWQALFDDGSRHDIDKNDFSLPLPSGRIMFDAVFMAIHGRPGEDGRLQGYLDMMGIPYTTCAHDTAALTFHKRFCNQFVRSLGIRVARAVYIKQGDEVDKIAILKDLGLPCFVKPMRSGSSIGISRVTEAAELDHAMEVAFREDPEIAIEENIPGVEITCGMLRTGKGLVVFPLTEIVSKKAFFDYEAKYTKGKSEEITPARVSNEVEAECKQISVRLYEEFSCKGLVRFDFIQSERGLYFLEANTVPGLSAASIIPQQANAMGISTRELFTMALQNALEGVLKK